MAQLHSQVLHVLHNSPGLYPYGDKTRIARDVANLLSVITTLKHQVARFMYDDGRSQLLFQLEGTVEIVYKGLTIVEKRRERERERERERKRERGKRRREEKEQRKEEERIGKR